jgi:hypothetical protein
MRYLAYDKRATPAVNLEALVLLAFQQGLVRFAKMTALLSAVWTLLVAVLIVGRQATSWLQYGVWDPYPLSSVINSVEKDRGSAYMTASSGRTATEVTILQGMTDWLLEIPAIVPLLIASVLLLVFYSGLLVIEKRYSTRD